MDIEYCGFNNPRGICQNIILQDFSTHEFYIKPKILNLKVSWANNMFYTQYSTLQVKECNFLIQGLLKKL
jgi:hypothetical protein